MIRRVLLACLVVSACSAPQPTPAPPPGSTPPPSSPATSAAPTYAQLQVKADRAVIPAAGMTDYDITAPKTDDDHPDTLTLGNGLCGKRPGYSLGPSRYRMFSGDRILLHNAAWVFQARTGKSVVEGIAAMGKSCTTWKDENGFDHKLQTDLTIAPPADVDAFFVYCDETRDANNPYRNCAALVARGDTVIEVATAAHISYKDTVVNLRDTLPRAVSRLLAA